MLAEIAETGRVYWTTDHFLLPLLLNGLQQIGSDFPHASLEGADL